MAVKKKGVRWAGTKKAGRPAQGKAKAESDRKLQREAEQRRRKAGGNGKQEGAVQAGERKYPQPPQPKQRQEKPGLESELEPRPEYLAPEYRGSGKLEDRIALITGGDSGIGRAVAVLFAREGADVAIVYLTEHEDAEETRRAVEAEGRRALLIPGDVTDSSFCEEAVETTVRELGGLDILVNNAAYQEHLPSLEDITDEQLDRTFRTNIYGYFFMARAALKHLKEGCRDHQQRLGHRDPGEQGAAGLRLHQGRDPRLHQVAGAEPGRAGHPGELRWRRDRCGPRSIRRTRTRRRSTKFGERRADEAAGAAGGGRAGLRLPRGAGLLQLHHRRGPAGARRRDRGSG